MTLDNRSKLLALVAGIALAALVADRFVISPAFKSWSDRSKRLSELRKRVTQGVVLLDREDTLRTRWKEMRANALSTEVSAAENQVLEAFDRWSQEASVSVSSIQPQRNQGSDLRIVQYRAQAFGNLSNLTRFLYLIEKDSLAVRIDSLELSVRDPQADQLTLVLQVSGWLLPAPGS